MALLLVAGLTVAVASPAQAINTTAPALSDFDLRPASNQSELMERVQLLDDQLPKLGVQNILLQASRDGQAMTNGVCNDAASDGEAIPAAYSFCWDPSDASSIGANPEWTPQGITTVADAQSDQLWGSAEPLVVSWYNDDSDYVKGTRITFIDPSSGNYQHVLLVYPTINSAGNASYMSLRYSQTSTGTSLHAGGIAWYGNYLYVADTYRGFRVFDMRYIFDLASAGSLGDTTDKTQIGRHDGVFYGHGYRYVMPEVGAWTSAAGAATGNLCTPGGSPRFSYVGLDRTGSDHLVTGEYCKTNETNEPGRVARWPLTASTGLPALTGGNWLADAAYRLPVQNVQGGVSHNGAWYLTKSHGTSANSDLLRTTEPTTATGLLDTPTRIAAGIGSEDLSYWSTFYGYGDVVWTVTEHPGRRMVYATKVSAFNTF